MKKRKISSSARVEGYFEYWHKNPPAPFNPDYNPEYVERYKKYHEELKRITHDKKYDSMPDEQYNSFVNETADELQKKYKLFRYAEKKEA